jgi:spore germination protein KB
MEIQVEQNKKGKITSGQASAMLYIGLLSPIIRLLPKMAVDMGGYVSWISVFVAFPVLFLLIWFWRKMMEDRKTGDSMVDVIISAVGKTGGKIAVSLFGLWLIFYVGFMLKSGAERLISSAYDTASPTLFILTILAVAVIVAMGKLKVLGRLSEIFFIIFGLVFIFIMIPAFADIDPGNLLPVTVYDTGNILKGAIPIINIGTVGVYLYFFKDVADSDNSNKVIIKRLFTVLAVILILLVTTIGVLSEPLIRKLQHPFFIMVRDLSVFGVVERVESVVIALWVVSDIVYVSMLLKICGEIFSKVTEKKNDKPYILSAAILALLPAFLAANTAFDLNYFSEMIIPGINMLIIFVMLPLIFVIGKIRIKKGKKRY